MTNLDPSTLFPHDFVWGTATSSYQIEGAAFVDKRSASIWDTFAHTPGKVANGDHGDIACDHYHLYEQDIKLMSEMGIDAYRFSISWSRLLPDGTPDSLNQSAVRFYQGIIDTCLEHGITPWVTLYHWDLPQCLHDQEQGWLDRRIIARFSDYAEVCFELFGTKVKHWITINEPWVIALLGYGQGMFAPGHESDSEPYLVGHNLLLAHAKAVKVYRHKFQKYQGGTIGITLNSDWREPKTQSSEDVTAAQRAMEFFLGWFADPLYFGDYPRTMRDALGDRLPRFSESEQKDLIHSSEFFGLNHYSTMYASEPSEDDVHEDVKGNGGVDKDQRVTLSVDPNWAITDMGWAVVPWGVRKLLHWIRDRYENPNIVITENGCAYDDAPNKQGIVNDQRRIEYYQSYLEECALAIQDGVVLSGYFAWSFMDNFEWACGYEKRFGLHYVDFKTQKRTAKQSAHWYREFIHKSK